MKRLITLFATLGLVAFVPTALAASGTLFGGATMSGKQVKLVSDLSDTSTANDASGINFADTGVTTFSSLTQLSTKFNVTNDSCGGGSPRFQINVRNPTTGAVSNVFVYLGPSPTFTGCAPNTLLESGNLIGNNDACRWDTSKIVAGTQCNTYAGALALVGSWTVTGIQLVVDSGWFFADKEQTVRVCDIRINQARLFSPCQGNGQGAGAGGGGNNKMTICHHTQQKKTGETKHVTITISQSAWPAHQKHGDTQGACTSAANLKAHSKAAHVKKFHKKGKKGRGR